MSSSNDDRRAAFTLGLLAVAGLLVRLFVTGDTSPAGAVGYRASVEARPARDTVAARAQRVTSPLGPGERLDLDRAPAEELVRLPRVGPGLAARIVAERERGGGFGDLEALSEVPGVGPTVLEAIRPHATFSAPAGLRRAGPDGSAGGAPVRVNTAGEEELQTLPGIGPATARAIIDDRIRNGPYRTPDDLARVRGIGPRTVERLRGRILVP